MASKIHFNPKDKQIEEIFDKLTFYPLVKVKPADAQIIGRYKKIREINHGRKNNPLIYIKGGLIGLNPKIKINKKDNGFDFEIF